MVIEIKNLSFAYPDGTAALDDISLNISAGESVGIIGPNGAGKSTLLLHLNGIFKSHTKILGVEATEENLPFIRSKVGLVFQDPDNQLFMPTVFDDVAFGPMNMGLGGAEIEKRVGEALKEIDMQDFARRSSHHLSFGEKKRLSIATVLSMNPEILVLDEPTSNLDPRHRRDMINILKGFNHTKIIATHDLEMVIETCSKVILINNRRLISQGSTMDILKDKKLLESNNLEVPYSLINR